MDLITVTSLDGVSLTQPLISLDILTTPGSTFEDDRLFTHSLYSTELVVATWVPAVPLIHQQSDVDEAEEDDDEDDDDEDAGGNAASTKTPGNGVVSVLGLALGILAGMGMLL